MRKRREREIKEEWKKKEIENCEKDLDTNGRYWNNEKDTRQRRKRKVEREEKRN